MIHEKTIGPLSFTYSRSHESSVALIRLDLKRNTSEWSWEHLHPQRVFIGHEVAVLRTELDSNRGEFETFKRPAHMLATNDVAVEHYNDLRTNEGFRLLRSTRRITKLAWALGMDDDRARRFYDECKRLYDEIEAHLSSTGLIDEQDEHRRQPR